MVCKKMMNIKELFKYEDNIYISCNIKVNLIKDKISDEDTYRDKLNIYIDEYVVKYPNIAKKLVYDYDVFRSIKLSKDNYGYFEIEEDTMVNYLTLGYVLIDEYFKKYYDYGKLRTDTEVFRKHILKQEWDNRSIISNMGWD